MVVLRLIVCFVLGCRTCIDCFDCDFGCLLFVFWFRMVWLFGLFVALDGFLCSFDVCCL